MPSPGPTQRRRHRLKSRTSLATWFRTVPVLALLAAVVLAQGGVFPAVPAAVFLSAWCALAIRTTWRARKGEAAAIVLPLWAAAPAAMGLLLALQLIPLPAGIVEALSPERARIASAAPVGPRGGFLPLSLHPAAAFDGLLLLAGALGLLLLVYNTCRSRVRIERMLLVFPILGSGLALWGLGTASTGEADYLFVNRNHYAAFLVIASLSSAGYLAYQLMNELAHDKLPFATWLEQMSWGRASLLLALFWAVVLQAGAILACGSRGGMLALAAGWVVLFGGSFRFPRLATARWVLGGVAGIVLGFLALTTFETTQARVSGLLARDMGVSFRLAVWSDAVSLYSRYPLAGTGWGGFDSALPAVQVAAYRWRFRHAESDLLEILVETGPLGLAIVLGGAAWLAWLSLKSWSDGSPHEVRHRHQAYLGVVCLGLLAGLAGFAVHELVDFPGRLPGVLYAAALAAGLLLAADRALARNADSAHPWPELALAPRPAAWALAGFALLFAWPAQRAARDVLAGSPLVFADLAVPETAERDAFAWRLTASKAARLYKSSVAIAPWRSDELQALAAIYAEAAQRLADDGMDLEDGPTTSSPDRILAWTRKSMDSALLSLTLDPANPETARAAAEAAERLHRSGPSPESALLVRKLWAWAAERGPSYTVPHLRYGLWLLEHGDYDAADAELSRALRLEADYQAEIIQAYRRYGRVEALVSRVVPADNEDGVVRVAQRLFALKEPGAAEALLLRSEKTLPARKAAYVRYMLGNISERKGDHEAAVRWFESALGHATPNFVADLRLALGRTLRRLGRLEDAARHLEAGLALQPGRYERWALIQLGGIYEDIGRLDRALACYDTLADREGDEEWIRKGAELRRRVGNIR